MLDNPLYVGDVRSKGVRYPGIHEAIVSKELWDEVQALRSQRTRAKIVEVYKTDLLKDLMFDGFGRKMAAFRDRRYSEVRRYYVSNQTEWGRRHGARRYRTKAEPLEALVSAAIGSLFSDPERLRGMLLKIGIHDGSLNKLCAAGPRIAKFVASATGKRLQCLFKAVIERVELSNSWIKLIVRTPEIPRVLRWDGLGLFRGDTNAWSRPHPSDVIDIPANAVSMKRELTLLLKRRKQERTAKPNRRLVGLLNKARVAQAQLDERSVCTVLEMAAKVSCHPKRFTRLGRLNYLAPDIIASIRDGTQPPSLDCRTLMAADLPMDWSLQRRLLGFPDQPDYLKAAPGW
jgi:hypothetical protein